MANFVEVGKTSELQDGIMKEVLAQGHEILLLRMGDKYYAADNRCPHWQARRNSSYLPPSWFSI